MPKFTYKARGSKGIVEGTLDASDRNAAGESLLQKNLMPIAIELYVEKPDPMQGLTEFLNGFGNAKKPKIETLIIFARQMTALMRAGVPLLTALRGLSGSVRGRVLADRLKEVANDIQSGLSLTVAFQKHTDIFDNILIAFIHVGENTGKLEDTFQQIAMYLEMERDTKRRIKQATRYPKIVVIGLTVAMVVMNMFVIPNFAKVFEKLGSDLPLMTRILLGTSNFTVNYWWLLAIIGTGGFILLKQWLATDAGTLKWDQYKLKLPIMGKIFERIALARFCNVFAALFGSGIPILQSLSAVSQTIGNEYIASRIRGMYDTIDRGEPLTRAATQSTIFTPLVLQMLAVGEETGRIDEMLLQVAKFYEEEIDYDLKQLADAIEPILLVAMGLMVLVLALGIFLPMWELGAASKK